MRVSLSDILDRAAAGETLAEADIVRLFAGPRRRFPRSLRRRRPAAPRGIGRHGDLCRHPQHQLHQYLLFPLPVLRLLEGQAQRESARPALQSRPRRNRPAQRGGLGARRHRSLPAGRHPPGIYRRDLSRGLPRDQAGAAGHARARLLAARSLAGGEDTGPHLARFRRRAARRRARLVARHRGGNPRRRGARGDLPRQGQDRRMAPGHGGGARRGPAQHGHDHVRPCRALRALGAPPAARARVAARGPAASPNSCRCRSCRWRRRSR